MLLLCIFFSPTIHKSLHSSLSASSPPSLPGGSPSSRLSGIGFGIARSLGVTSCVDCEQKDVQIFKLKNTIQNYEQQLNDKDTVTTEQTTAIIKANEENENLKEQVRILNQSVSSRNIP
ncbi:uncharacterized protein [Clytia hemisphaerica]|uniref:uncharacterized protein n=1 Tax=Clytia hemisphaerica TaxID=252671 RepID=UPI0034D773ED